MPGDGTDPAGTATPEERTLGEQAPVDFQRPGPADGRLVRDLVREVVAEVEPKELSVVADLERRDEGELYRELSRPSRDEPLGFGWEALAGLAATALWLVLGKLAERGAETAAAGLIERLFKRRKRQNGPAVIPAKTREELPAFRQTLRDEFVRHGLTAERAARIADAVVVRLVIEPERPEPGAAEED